MDKVCTSPYYRFYLLTQIPKVCRKHRRCK